MRKKEDVFSCRRPKRISTPEQGGAQAKPSNTLSESRIMERAGAESCGREAYGILRQYIPKSWYHDVGIHKVLADLIPRLPNVKGSLFLTLTIDAKLFSSPEEAYEKSRDRIRRIFYKLRKGVEWKGKLFRINAPYCVKTEFHKSGYAHFHLILLTRRFLPKELLENLWSFGLTDWPKRISNEKFRYLLKYITKGGELPDWVLKRNRIRVFQPSHGFLAKAEETVKKSDTNEDKEVRPKTTIGERILKWKHTAILDLGKTERGKRRIETIPLKGAFHEILGQLVYPAALDGRYLGGGKIKILKKKELKQWIQNPTQNSNSEQVSSLEEYQSQMRPQWEPEKMEPNGFVFGMN